MSTRPRDIPPYPRGDGEQTVVAPKRGALAGTLTVVGLLLVAAALTVAAYPFASARWESSRAERQFTAERAMASQYDEQEVDREIAAAEAYNAAIAGMLADDAAGAYEGQLDYGQADVLCWLDIPRLGITLPVYRDDGTGEVPPDGAEHVRGSSLPVGGLPSNTVITAHSGSHGGTSMAFNKLDLLDIGDSIVLWTYGRPYAYKVSGWQQTDPQDVSHMKIVGGIDQLTLLTCRPIGTTAKRLFVHANRTSYDDAGGDGRRIESFAEPDFWQFVAALAAGGAVFWILLLLAFCRKTIWYLNRTLGTMALAESDIVGFAEDGEPAMCLQLKSFGRARLSLFGDEAKGSWRRVEGDDSRIVLSFGERADTSVTLASSATFAEWGIDSVELPPGRFEAQALDNELAFGVDCDATRLVFSRNRPQTQEGHRDRSERARR